ncbi:MAG: DUF1566 domain-containing protein, partial [Deltaproteobacteria bacterium]|nr:DUF1566 domain-containing protein [Deltaproteobacteria bacterium]
MRRQKIITTLFTLVVLLYCLPGMSQSQPAPVPKTGQTKSYGIRDDGALQLGVAWPNQRFTDNSDGTVTDNLTGLIWLKDAGCIIPKNWNDALTSANGLVSGSCGLSDGSKAGDWHLPNTKELASLADYGNPLCSSVGLPFTGISPNDYWVSTTGGEYQWDARSVNPSYGDVNFDHMFLKNNVWPVRCGQTGSFPAPVPKTGQTTSTAAGDDGALQLGVASPNPRFTDNSNGTVTDNLTGLIWLKSTNCFTSKNWNDALTSANGLVSGSCGLSDGSKAGDWQLPSMKELISLIDYGHYPALPPGNPFTGIDVRLWSYEFWSSTTYAGYSGSGFAYTFYGAGEVGYMDKTLTASAWPVRGGQTHLPTATPKPTGTPTPTPTPKPTGTTTPTPTPKPTSTPTPTPTTKAKF